MRKTIEQQARLLIELKFFLVIINFCIYAIYRYLILLNLLEKLNFLFATHNNNMASILLN